MPGGKNQPINPPNYLKGFAKGRMLRRARNWGRAETAASQHMGELLTVKQDASPAERFLSHIHASFPDKKKIPEKLFPASKPGAFACWIYIRRL